MSKISFPILKTDRLSLRRLLPSDWEMISYLRSDKVANQFVKRPNASSKEKALTFISKINTSIDAGTFCYWAITKIDNDQMMGSICLWNFSKDKRTAEVGYDLSPAHQG